MATTGLVALTGGLFLVRRTSIEGLDRTIGRSILCFGTGLVALAASLTLRVTLPAFVLVGSGLVSSAYPDAILQSRSIQGKDG